MWRNHYRSEEGLALITALFAILILLGLSVLFVAAARNLTAQSRISTAYERAIHLGEASIDDVIARANRENPDDPSTMYVSTWDDDGNTSTPPVPVVYNAPPNEEAWALARAARATDLITYGEGQAVAIRPENTVGTPLDVIYGVGYVPSRAAPREIRVIKVQFQRKLLNPDFALQTGPGCGVTPPPGGLQMQGNGKILDGNPSVEPPANVHSNGPITVVGNSFTVQGNVTSQSTVSGSVGTSTPKQNQPCVPIPRITPRQLYKRSSDSNFWVGGNTERWDLCYDALGVPFARLPDPNGTPCANTTGQVDVSSVGQFRGWTFDDAKLTWRANAVSPGIYYIYGATAKVLGSTGSNPQPVTLLIEALKTDGAGSGSSCNGNNTNTGNLCMQGNPKLIPALKDTLFVVDRDIEFGGNPGTELAGFVTAGEQISATGSAALAGAMLAQDTTDTTASVIHENLVSGSLTLTFQEGLNPPIDSVVQIVAWNEL